MQGGNTGGCLFSLLGFNNAELRQVSTVEVKDRREKGPMKLKILGVEGRT